MSIFTKAINQWCYGIDRSRVLPRSINLQSGTIFLSEGTDINVHTTGAVQIAILGLCVDALGEWDSNEIAQKLSELGFAVFSKSIDRLCGSFVILRIEGVKDVSFFADATHLMPIYYCVSGSHRGAVASCEALLVDAPEKTSPQSRHALKWALEGGCYLAGDMTMYDEVKCLLANHYLDLAQLKSVRYFPREELRLAETESEINDLVNKTISMVGCAIKQFAEKFHFACPLTVGDDSRANCALLNHFLPNDDVMYYVIKTPEFTKEPRNLELLDKVVRALNLPDFKILPIEQVIGEDVVKRLKDECGDIRGWGRSVWAYHSSIGDRAIARGDIVDQIGKSSFGLPGWPEWIARWAGYTAVFQKNLSPYAHRAHRKWVREARSASRGYSIYDLWSWEMRLGRWNSNTTSINYILGIKDVNFYNCAQILDCWCRIPRAVRDSGIVHKRIYELFAPTVKGLPTNPYVQEHHNHLPPILVRILPLGFRLWGKYVVAKMRHILDVYRDM